ncbi:hypothetical protein L6R29_12975 [Myxococcota bacterium]|nr:hypothetical protein [Myxococcota bacterium]
MSSSFELEHPLQERKTLRGWIPLAAPVLLHTFACDSAERMLCICERAGHVIDPTVWKALYTKRRWIEGKQGEIEQQEVLRALLSLTLEAIDVDMALAWSYLAVAEAIHHDAQEAALKTSSKTARAAAILALSQSQAASPNEETHPSLVLGQAQTRSPNEETHLSLVLGQQTKSPSAAHPCLYAPSVLRRGYLLRTTASISQWQEHPYFQQRWTPSLRAWIFERFWQEDHLAMLISMMSRARHRLLSALLQRQDSKTQAAQRWQHLWQDVLFEA